MEKVLGPKIRQVVLGMKQPSAKPFVKPVPEMGDPVRQVAIPTLRPKQATTNANWKNLASAHGSKVTMQS